MMQCVIFLHLLTVSVVLLSTRTKFNRLISTSLKYLMQLLFPFSILPSWLEQPPPTEGSASDQSAKLCSAAVGKWGSRVFGVCVCFKLLCYKYKQGKYASIRNRRIIIICQYKTHKTCWDCGMKDFSIK